MLGRDGSPARRGTFGPRGTGGSALIAIQGRQSGVCGQGRATRGGEDGFTKAAEGRDFSGFRFFVRYCKRASGHAQIHSQQLQIAVAIAAGIVIPLLLTSSGSGGSGAAGQRQVQNNGGIQINGNNNGQVAGTINNVGSTVNGGGLSNDPQGFVDAIVNRDTRIVALYLQSGMKATTR